MTRSSQAVAHRQPSVLHSAADGRHLGLETSRGATPAGVEDHPRFFAGFLTSPQVAAALPLLAESGGTAGAGTHLCVAYGLGARQPEDRLAAVDALLVLAARRQLDAERLGADLGQPVRRGAVEPLRLAESARTAAATGANTTIWEMLRLAAECAERSGARGALPHLPRAAARRGSSRLVVQARRLRDALAEEVAA